VDKCQPYSVDVRKLQNQHFAWVATGEGKGRADAPSVPNQRTNIFITGT